jgi:phosphatidylserine synthase
MENENYEPISVSNWLLTFIVTAIPILNIVVILYWSLSKNTHPSKMNYARAMILLFVIGVVLYAIFATFLFSQIAEPRY